MEFEVAQYCRHSHRRCGGKPFLLDQTLLFRDEIHMHVRHGGRDHDCDGYDRAHYDHENGCDYAHYDRGCDYGLERPSQS